MGGFNPPIHPARVYAPRDSLEEPLTAAMDGRLKAAHDECYNCFKTCSALETENAPGSSTLSSVITPLSTIIA